MNQRTSCRRAGVALVAAALLVLSRLVVAEHRYEHPSGVPEPSCGPCMLIGVGDDGPHAAPAIEVFAPSTASPFAEPVQAARLHRFRSSQPRAPPL